MAAYAAVLSLNLIIKKNHQHTISLHPQQLHSLTENLSSLQAFLEAYSKEEDDLLESRIADAVYAAEDVIESHVINQIQTGSTCHEESTNWLDLYHCLERVIQDMDLIKKEVMQKKILGGQHHQLNSSVSVGQLRDISCMQNSFMVDFGDILNDIMYKLTNHQHDLEIVPIVGMGGIGETTLAKSIYAHPLIVQHFDILAWVTISQEYSWREILLRVLSEENNGAEMSDHEVGIKVYKKLWGTKYLIMMDDIWNVEAWDKVKTYFPNNSNGRLSKLAFQLSGSHDFQMRFLDCPNELENIGKEIVENCRGLPLSIVVVGGVLKKSIKTREYWEYTLKNLTSQINLENNEHCFQILRKSYKELPIHIKPCFLYMGVFPEDYEIYVPDLVELLVAEGILKPIENKSPEDVAKEYVKELVERNLVLAHKLSWNGKIKSCKIHDLLRDVYLREGTKQRFICVLRGQDQNVPRDMNRERRICIHDNIDNKYSPEVIHAVESASLTRSLIVFGGAFCRPPPSSTCRLLRVLSCLSYLGIFRGGNNSDAEVAFQQANLRYLCLDILEDAYRFPASWYLLRNLQTLVVDIFQPVSAALAPSEIWKMSHLRHLKFHKLQLSNPPPSGEDHFVLEKLQSLGRVHDFNCSEEVAKRIPNIRKLNLRYKLKNRYEKKGLSSFSLNNLVRLTHLKSLSLHLDSAISYHDPETMQNLDFPHSLEKLSLSNTRVPWDDLTAKIGSLPLLQVLKLGRNSCVGPEWETVEGQFCSLKLLYINGVSDLRCWKTDNTHFPLLEHLVLECLSKLEEIPLSIGDIPTLVSIKVGSCHKSIMASAERIKEEQLSYGNEDLQVLMGQ